MSFETAPVRGIVEHYGKRSIDAQYGGDFGTKNGTKQVVYEYEVTALPADGGGNMAVIYPAYSKIESVYSETVEAIVGLTSPTVTAVIGSYNSGAESLAATVGATAKDEPAAPTSIGATADNLVVTLGGTGTATAGKIRTVVTYVMPKQ